MHKYVVAVGVALLLIMRMTAQVGRPTRPTSQARALRASSTQPEYFGLVALKSVHGKYLQAVEHEGHNNNGELHASNSHINEEESWLLFAIDKDNGYFRLQNFKNKKYLSRSSGDKDCTMANAVNAGGLETWVLRDGTQLGQPGRVFLQSKATSKYIKAQGEGDDTHCGGEVSSDDGGPPSRAANWEGWWSVEAAPDPPTSGRSVFTVFGDIGRAFENVAEALCEVICHIHIN